jgi:hypothetical protein
MNSRRRCGWVLITVALLLGCDHHDDLVAIKPATPPVSCIRVMTISPQFVRLRVGDTVRFAASGADCDAPPLTEWRWSTTNPSKAVIDSVSGLARAVGIGTVTIVAEAVVARTIKGAGLVEVVP